MPLVSIVLGPQYAHSGGAPRLRAPRLQGGLRTCELLPAAVKLAACEGGVFPLRKGVSASSTPVRIVRCCRSSSHPVFSSVSGVIFPRVVVSWLCPREEVSSESAYAAILTPVSCLLSFIASTRRRCERKDIVSFAT